MKQSAKTLTVLPGIWSGLDQTFLWIRTASGPQKGLDHLKRTMSLARSLNDCCMPLFLIDPQDRWIREHLAANGMASVCEPLDSIWSRLPKPKAVLIDTRNTDGLESFINEAGKRHLSVISIHDLGLAPLQSDIAIDGSIDPDFSNFSNSDAAFYSGTSYTILSPVYHLMHEQDKHIGDRIRSVFINLGGGNSSRIFIKVLEGLQNWNRKLEVIGVPGFSSWGQESLSRRNWDPLHFQWSTEPIAPYCYKADIAITAGELSAYEALCTGTPLLALSCDQYQHTTVRMLENEGACINLGSGNDFKSNILPRILFRIESDRNKRRALSTKGRNIVDGRGVERVASIIREAIGTAANESLLKRVG